MRKRRTCDNLAGFTGAGDEGSCFNAADAPASPAVVDDASLTSTATDGTLAEEISSAGPTVSICAVLGSLMIGMCLWLAVAAMIWSEVAEQEQADLDLLLGSHIRARPSFRDANNDHPSM
eukprot:TRINITY_DN29190_c0_g1_i1.p2 TRINITY_DN29190_c0_g1~~TRINITY_DN29190_c0_g1_i1.p2  ORF type:complete len:120 (+),score=24.47 TRINITY_DN29190_c0_g1_i1:131-490(+)